MSCRVQGCDPALQLVAACAVRCVRMRFCPPLDSRQQGSGRSCWHTSVTECDRAMVPGNVLAAYQRA